VPSAPRHLGWESLLYPMRHKIKFKSSGPKVTLKIMMKLTLSGGKDIYTKSDEDVIIK